MIFALIRQPPRMLSSHIHQGFSAIFILNAFSQDSTRSSLSQPYRDGVCCSQQKAGRIHSSRQWNVIRIVVRRSRVRIGIEAPSSVRIQREEIACEPEI